jgi:hypothetical protein
MNERRGQDHGKTNDEQDEGERRKPRWQAKPFREALDQLIADRRSNNIDRNHLPDRTAVDLTN